MHRILCFRLLLAGSSILLGGCAHDEDALVTNPDGTHMTRDQMLSHGEDLIDQGEKLKADGVLLKDAGSTDEGEKTMGQGDELILKGEKLKDRAMMTPVR